MVWKESEASVWVDDLDGAEKVFYNMSQAFSGLGKEHGSVYAVCKISVQNSDREASLETLLCDAWRNTRFEFPGLSVVADGSTKEYVAATAERVEHWVGQTFSVDAVHSALDIVSTLHLRRLPCLIFLPPSSEVIFHCSHWRIDALGACMVLDRLFDLASQGSSTRSIPQWDLEYQNLSPSLEDAFGSPYICSPIMDSMAEAIRKRNFDTSYPSAGLPYNGDITTKPGRSRSQAIELTVQSTKDLVAACKTRGISVTAAVHAACAEAVFSRSKNNDHSYSTVVSANMRGSLPVPQNDNTKTAYAYACGTYVTGITHTLRRADNFATRSLQLTQAYRGSWATMEYMTALRPIYKIHGEALAAIARSGTRLPASNVTVSSLGIIEKYLRSDHGTIVVERFRLGSAILTRQPTLYIWTFHGRLTLSLDFNESYYNMDATTALLESIRQFLERELQLILEINKEALLGQ
ncbi:hypothetical protein F5X99DRAFT_427579 [Biscogniauxia marginata]|nr:hypothetical protein F5X99DRAFT_427579 [Biscogniauxia marginata]